MESKLIQLLSVVLYVASVCAEQVLHHTNRFVGLKEALLTKVGEIETNEKQFRPIERWRDAVKHHYKRGEQAPMEQSHEGVFFLRGKNIEEMEKLLFDVSDPRGENYGRFLTKEEIDERFFDSERAHHVYRVLELNGFTITTTEHGSSFITASAPVYKWQDLLNTKFHEYSLVDSGSGDHQTKLIRAEHYSLPSELWDHVDYVLNIVSFPLPQELKHAVVPKRRADAAPITVSGKSGPMLRGYVTPARLTSYYDIRNTTGNIQASQAVYETIGQTFSPSDLTLFQRTFRLKVESVAKVINGHANDNACATHGGNDCIEANLDVQYLMAVGENVPTTYYYWTGKDFMLDWIRQVAVMRKPPQVISISYGADESFIAASYAASFNDVAMRLGLMGVTIVASSGDDGAISTGARTNPTHCAYAPSFPASSPYVVAVGGTMGPESGTAEVACQGDKGGIITTGGGFSTLYPVPTWQAEFTQGYLNRVRGTAQEPFEGYESQGRGIPDISFLAYNYVIAAGNNFTAVSGTSASSPVFAGMISLVNSARQARGLAPVGWVLPALYRLSDEYLWDITQGDNRCVAQGTVCCSQGFFATTGWDPVTGLGSLNFTSFLNAMVHPERYAPTLPPTYAPGSPTPLPSLKPTPSPSSHPTFAPTYARGYLRVLEYEGENCEGSVTTVSGAAADICLVEYDQTGSAQGSVKYVCEHGRAVMSLFSDTHCSPDKLLQSGAYAYGCAYRVAENYYETAFNSVAVDCVAGADSSALLSGLSGHYAVQISYGNPGGCTSGYESSAIGVLQDHCFDLDQQDASYRIHFPMVSYYRHIGCHGRVAKTETLSTTCEELASYGYSGYGSRRLVESEAEAAQGDDQSYYGYGSGGTVDLFAIWSDKRVTAPTASPTRAILRSSQPSPSPSTAPSHRSPTPLPSTFAPSNVPSTLPTTVVVHNDDMDDSLPNTPTSLPTTAAVHNDDMTDATTNAPSSMPTSSNIPVIEDDQTADAPSASPSAALSLAPTVRTSPLPSVKPTAYPSARPTTFTIPATFPPTTSSESDRSATVYVSVHHILAGVSASAWKACGSSCITTLKTAVADVVDGISPWDITMLSSTDFSPTRLSQSAVRRLRQHNLQSLSPLAGLAANLTYVITTTAATLNAVSSQDAIRLVSQRLQTAVSDSSFDNALHYYAAGHQVTPLLSATTVAVSANPSTAPPSEGDSNGSETAGNGKSPKSATALVIGFVAVLLCAVVVVAIYLVVACGGRGRLQQAATSLSAAVRKALPGRAIRGRKGGRSAVLSTYIELPLNGESMHALRSPGVDETNVDDDDDVEIVEFRQSADAEDSPYPGNRNAKFDGHSGVVANPVLTKARMIQSDDDTHL